VFSFTYSRVLLTACLLLFTLMHSVIGQTPSANDLKQHRNRGLVMLQLVKDYVKEYYNNPSSMDSTLTLDSKSPKTK
jgi:hypothetical protein